MKTVAFVGAGLFAATLLVLPAIQASRETGSPPPACPYCLKQVSLALHQYHADYGSLPPVQRQDSSDGPTHSWRVAILPYLGMQDLYDQYDFDQPWDSPNNAEVGKLCPKEFQCWKCSANGITGTTTILAVSGPATCWPSDHSVSLDQVLDGPNRTVMLIGLAESNVNWLQPVDYTVGNPLPSGRHRESSRRSVSSRQDTSGWQSPAHYVAFADGSVRLLNDKQDIAPLSTIAGGEYVDLHQFE